MITLFVVGSAVGLGLPKNRSLPTPWYRSLSAAIGYIYFVAWSVSFYPQVLSNFRRRSTVGLSPDFCVLNVIGFACYATYNVAFFYSKTIQDLYKKRHGEDAEITVQSNDVAFALHAFILSSVTVLQIMYYGGGIKSLKVSKPIRVAIFCILVICAVYPILTVNVATTQYKNDPTLAKYHSDNNFVLERFNWLDYLYLLSFVKIGISLIKYIPQVILNYRRKSTVGWSIWNILLDFTGGILSDLQVRLWADRLSFSFYNLIDNYVSSHSYPSTSTATPETWQRKQKQLVLDCADLKDFSGITGNPAKFGLGFVSIVFDVVFMVQHYLLYSDNSNNHNHSHNRGAEEQERRSEQEEPLLEGHTTNNNFEEVEGGTATVSVPGPEIITV
jgi:cystinosin